MTKTKVAPFYLAHGVYSARRSQAVARIADRTASQLTI